jgi:hypothetical protein
LKHPSAVNLDHMQTVERARLVAYAGSLAPAQMRAVCRVLPVATGCSDCDLLWSHAGRRTNREPAESLLSASGRPSSIWSTVSGLSSGAGR